MRVHVNGNCIACGMCAQTCPRVFKVIGNKSRALPLNFEGAIKEAALSAAENCPMEAIETK